MRWSILPPPRYQNVASTLSSSRRYEAVVWKVSFCSKHVLGFLHSFTCLVFLDVIVLQCLIFDISCMRCRKIKGKENNTFGVSFLESGWWREGLERRRSWCPEKEDKDDSLLVFLCLISVDECFMMMLSENYASELNFYWRSSSKCLIMMNLFLNLLGCFAFESSLPLLFWVLSMMIVFWDWLL